MRWRAELMISFICLPSFVLDVSVYWCHSYSRIRSQSQLWWCACAVARSATSLHFCFASVVVFASVCVCDVCICTECGCVCARAYRSMCAWVSCVVHHFIFFFSSFFFRPFFGVLLHFQRFNLPHIRCVHTKRPFHVRIGTIDDRCWCVRGRGRMCVCVH